MMTTTRFTEDHEWIRPEADGSLTVGITDHAQDALGDVVFVELPAIGSHFGQGDAAAVVESVKAAADVKMPIAGEVIAVNESLADDPAQINSDPMGAAWFMKIRPDQAGDLDALMDEAAYKALIGD